MRRYIVGGIFASIFVIVGAVIVTNGSSNKTENFSSFDTTSQQEVSTQSDAVLTERYIEYSEANLASSVGTKQILFFHAPWCSTCNAFEKEIIADGVPEEITILKADYDSETDLKQKYGVRLQSTFVLLDENGEVEQAWPFGQGLSNDIANLYDQVI